MLNHIVIMGRLVRDPELRRTGSGTAVASFTVAVDRDFAPKNGGERETDFIDCVAWRQTGEFVSKYFCKGSMIVVTGRLQLRDWQDKDGNKRRSAEILVDSAYFGESKQNDKGSQSAYSAPSAPAVGGYPAQPGSFAPPTNGYSAPVGGYAPPAGGYGTPGSDFAMLDDDGAQLPF